MLGAFENTARVYPGHVFYAYVPKQDNASISMGPTIASGSRPSLDSTAAAPNEYRATYAGTRMMAAALAMLLNNQGVRRGDCIQVDLPNHPIWPLLILAAGYGGFTLIAMNNSLTQAEKQFRMLEIDSQHDVHVRFRIDRNNVDDLHEYAEDMARGRRLATSYGKSVYPHDSEEAVLHYAERSFRMFDSEQRALILFTSGTTGTPKAVPMTWNNLIGAATAANAALSTPGSGIWQLVLPLYYISGFQIVLRSIMNGNSFVLYEQFEARQVMRDAGRLGVSHICVSDEMLQGMLGTGVSMLGYKCILMDGQALDPATVSRAKRMGLKVYASYGLTETCSAIAASRIDAQFAGQLELFPGYEARIVDADPRGFGRLSIKGPGVIAQYLNARTPRTFDGFFLTDDQASLDDQTIYVREKSDDVFISGGESVYPSEITQELLRVPGVSDAYVFAAPDATWGLCPVAFVERSRSIDAAALCELGLDDPGLADDLVQCSDQGFAAYVRMVIHDRFSRASTPREICVLDSFPRAGVGRLDNQTLELVWRERLAIKRVKLHMVELPLVRPFNTSKTELTMRRSMIVEVVDYEGRTGLGECVAFDTRGYFPETLNQDAAILHRVLAPKVTHEVYLHPSQVHRSLLESEEAASYPMARAAIENALWDLYGKITDDPLWKLVGGRAAEPVQVPVSCSIGMMDVDQTLAAVRNAVAAGYSRIKLKIAPGRAYARAFAVRNEFPHIDMVLDANQSFTEANIDELRALDTVRALWLEEPLDPRRAPAGAPTDFAARLKALQSHINTPICLDESIVTLRQAYYAIENEIAPCLAIKVGKFGGIQPVLELIEYAQSHKVSVWMGGMYDTGISRRMHAALQLIPGVNDPGDVGAVSQYFPADVAQPAYEGVQGVVLLNENGYEAGLGCELNRETLHRYGVGSVVIE